MKKYTLSQKDNPTLRFEISAENDFDAAIRALDKLQWNLFECFANETKNEEQYEFCF